MKFRMLGAVAALATGLAAAPVHAQEVVNLGFSGPLSGGAAKYGTNVLDGMKMAVGEINATNPEIGGKKIKFEIVSYDDKYNPSETAINAQRLVQESKTPAILVPHSGGILALQTTNEQQDYLVLGYTSVPAVTARGNKLSVRIPPNFTTYIPMFVKYSMGKWGKKLAFAHGDHDYAKAWTKEFKPAWEAAGGTVVAENPMSYNRAADFYSGVSRALAEKPDVLFVGGASEPTALVIKQARELGFKGGFVIIDQAKMDEIARVLGGYEMLEGSIGVLPVADDPSPATQDWVKRFKAIYPDRIPSSEISLNYTAIWATFDAMKMAGTATDAKAIRAKMNDAYAKMDAKHNPGGTNGIGADGGSTADTRVAVVEGGKVKELRMSDLK